MALAVTEFVTDSATAELSSTPEPTPTPLPSSTPVPTPIPPTATSMPPATPSVRVVEFFRADQCYLNQDKEIFSVAWDNPEEFTYSYSVRGESAASGYSFSSLIWKTYNIVTGQERTSQSRMNLKDSLFPADFRKEVLAYPDLTMFYSPSGQFLIFSSGAKVSVAETKGERKWKIQDLESEYLGLARSDWSADENTVAFSISYEGPSEIYVSDFKTKKSVLLSEIADVNGFTENPWDLSTNGDEIAFVDFDNVLKIVSIESGRVKVVPGGGTQPVWSEDGSYVYYWWRLNAGEWYGKINELRAYNMQTGEVETILDRADLDEGFKEFRGSGECISEDFYVSQNLFAVSPDQGAVVLYNDWLYLVIR
jgi:hypothetical protein